MTSKTPRQLILGVALNDDATLDNFYLPDGSVLHQVVASLQDMFAATDGSFLYLRGVSGTGVTHLLQAACHQAADTGLSAQYLPLNDLHGYVPAELLDGMEYMSLVSLDNLQAVAGNADWERALFDFFNRIRDQGNRLLIGAAGAAGEIGIQLPDLLSRLNWGIAYQLPVLDDDEKAALLCFRADRRGLEMSENTARYILNRAPRDMHRLVDILENLDKASLEEQRKITIPFIRQVLALSG